MIVFIIAIMLKKFREQRYIQRHVTVPIPDLLKEIEMIRQLGDRVILTPRPHENNWRGIYNGAMAFLPNQVFAIPQLFSRPVVTDVEVKQLCSYIVHSGFTKIIFSGYTVAFRPFITSMNSEIKKEKSAAKIYLIHHSSFTSNREDAVMMEALQDILLLYEEGLIHRIGFIKKGMQETFKVLRQVDAHYLIHITPEIPQEIISGIPQLSGIHFGVFTHFSYRKNIDNQVAAALQIPGSLVHVHQKKELDYLQMSNIITEHPFIENHFEFLKLIGSMTITRSSLRRAAKKRTHAVMHDS